MIFHSIMSHFPQQIWGFLYELKVRIRANCGGTQLASTEAIEAGESQSLKPVNLAYLYSKFQASQSYMVRSCLSKKKIKIA